MVQRKSTVSIKFEIIHYGFYKLFKNRMLKQYFELLFDKNSLLMIKMKSTCYSQNCSLCILFPVSLLIYKMQVVDHLINFVYLVAL